MPLKNVCGEFRYGKIIYMAGDAYIGRSLALYGEYSEGEAILFRQLLRPGQTVVEVGSNIGSLTIPLAQTVGEKGRVYAFEPQRLVFQILAGNMALNNLHNVFCYNKGVGSKNDKVTIPDLTYETGANCGGYKMLPVEDGYQVDVVTLDSLDIEACQLLKIDVEGMELEVLRGAEKLIREKQPFIYMEIEASLFEQEKKWLKARGYRLYRHSVPLYNSDNYFNVNKNVFLERVVTFEGNIVENGNPCSFNMLCIPEKLQIEMRGFAEEK